MSELADLRRELSSLRWYIDDEDLRDEVVAWINESRERTEADSARDYLDKRLTALLSANAMYHAPEYDHGAEAFPDECADCRHYGGACPVLVDKIEIEWRERLLEQAETDDEAREIYQQQAIDVGCKRIPEFLEEYDNQHREVVQRGQELLDRVEDHLTADLDHDGSEALDLAVGAGGEAGG